MSGHNSPTTVSGIVVCLLMMRATRRWAMWDRLMESEASSDEKSDRGESENQMQFLRQITGRCSHHPHIWRECHLR